MHLVCPPKFSITTVFSWDDCITQEKLETMVIRNLGVGGGGGINKVHYGLCKNGEFSHIPFVIERFHPRGQHICKVIGTNESIYIRKRFLSHRIAWNTNMATISLFWNTNMAAVTSCENSLSLEIFSQQRALSLVTSRSHDIQQ